jgi:hypothetical protein
MVKKNTQLYQPGVLQYIVCYAVWICLAVAAIWLAVQVKFNLLDQPLPFSGLDYRVVRVITDASTIIMGFITLVIIILMEHFLRLALTKSRFWPVAIRIVIIEAIVLALSYAGNLLLLKAFLKG